MNHDAPVKLADRMAYIEPFHVMSLLASARQMEAQGRHIVHMEIGEPDFVTPDPVLRAAAAAISQGKTHYTPAAGLTLLREKIAAFYATQYQVDVDPQQVIITPGASGALLLALGVLVNSGDRVVMSDPGYPCNRHFVRLYGGDPLCLPVDASTRFQLTVDVLTRAAVDPIAAVMLASPANPTGTVLAPQEIDDWITFVQATQNCYLLMDEIYQGLVYGGPSSTIAGRCDRTFVINSFSKYFCMTGWRLGWLLVPAGYAPHVEKLAQNIFLAPSTVAQYAALAAFEPENLAILEQRRREFARRRDFLAGAIEELGFRLPAQAQGAFYLYADCSELTDDSFTFCQRLLQEVGVAITPGKDFGAHASERYVRFAYTTAMDQLQAGVEQIRRFVRRD